MEQGSSASVLLTFWPGSFPGGRGCPLCCRRPAASLALVPTGCQWRLPSSRDSSDISKRHPVSLVAERRAQNPGLWSLSGELKR